MVSVIRAFWQARLMGGFYLDPHAGLSTAQGDSNRLLR
jgi:hypothetical protein